MSNTSLPKGFEALESFVEEWSLDNGPARKAKRQETTPEQQTEFFNAVKDLIPKALEELDKKDLNAFSDEEQRLMNMMLSFAHISLAVEVQRDHEPRQNELRKNMKLTVVSADQ